MSATPQSPQRDWVAQLTAIMAQLRGADGCPWDRQQTHASLKQFLLEETAEFFDAIDAGDDASMADELGDVLLQVVFHCQIATEQNRFDLQDVARRCCEKMWRRHPHVFGSGNKLSDADSVLSQWEEIKKTELPERRHSGALSGVPRHLPALHRAHKIQNKAAKVGFEWATIDQALAKIEEEYAEVRAALASGNAAEIEEEIGDLLFAVVNVSRFHGRVAEELLHSAISKFERRFARLEAELQQQGKASDNCSVPELTALWDRLKHSGIA